ncbi:MAG: NfeD family protein [Treponema sp.]|nr:NfeD family protein [Treponema sp.]
MTEFLANISPWLWLGVLIVCVIIEAFTMGLTTIWAAIAALPLIFIARTGLAFKWQLLIFAIITIILIVFTRPFAVKKLKIGKDKTNVNTMIGEEVIITQSITKFQKGQAKAKNGVIWTAKSDEDQDIPEGSVCLISAVEGNTISVKLNSENTKNNSEE